MKNSWEKKHIFMVLHLGPADRHHICQNKLRDRNFGPQKFTQKTSIAIKRKCSKITTHSLLVKMTADWKVCCRNMKRTCPDSKWIEQRTIFLEKIRTWSTYIFSYITLLHYLLKATWIYLITLLNHHHHPLPRHRHHHMVLVGDAIGWFKWLKESRVTARISLARLASCELQPPPLRNDKLCWEMINFSHQQHTLATIL